MIRSLHKLSDGTAMLALLAVLVGGLSALAQENPGQQQLEALRQRIEQEKRKQARLEQERQALEREMARIKRDLTEKAGRIQALEQEIAAHDARLHQLQQRHDALLAQLAATRHDTMYLLAALQRLRGDPPPPFVTRPEDVLKALRSALAMGAVLPRLRQRAQTLRMHLQKLVRLRRTLEKTRARKKTQQEQLQAVLAQMNGLLRVKTDLLAKTKGRLQAHQRRLASLLKQARTLEDLLRSLAKRQDAPKPDDRPSIAFAQLKGRLPWPAQGSALISFGQKTTLAGTSGGLYLATRPRAIVTTPADARVVVAGPFRSYGKLVILDMGNGYRILLAGMEKTLVKSGEILRAGEPVGQMGQRPQPATIVDERIDTGRPILYMELRNQGQALDPASWFAGMRATAHKG